MAGYIDLSQLGECSATSSPIDEVHPVGDLQEVEEAIAYASEALDAAQRLEEIEIDPTVPLDPLACKLLDTAVENYIDRFRIPTAALENNTIEHDDGTPVAQVSRLKKVMLYLYALVQRIFKAIFDFFSNQKLVARKLIPLTKQYIGESDSLSEELASKLSIKDRTVIKNLQINGTAPQNTIELYDALATEFEKQHAFVALPEVMRLVAATKEKNVERIQKEAESLRDKLEAGLKATLSSVNPDSLPVFAEKKADGVHYYVSKPLFGNTYIVGIIAEKVSENGTFRFKCGVRQDENVPARTEVFPVLSPSDIRSVCRGALKVCENIVRFSRDEELMKKALREATFLSSKEADESAVVALRNIVAVGQNSYITYLRFIAHVTESLMRWCGVSVRAYHNVEKPHE